VPTANCPRLRAGCDLAPRRSVYTAFSFLCGLGFGMNNPVPDSQFRFNRPKRGKEEYIGRRAEISSPLASLLSVSTASCSGIPSTAGPAYRFSRYPPSDEMTPGSSPRPRSTLGAPSRTFENVVDFALVPRPPGGNQGLLDLTIDVVLARFRTRRISLICTGGFCAFALLALLART